jgi:tetratricopeptide (TPR) repeat protein
MVGTAGSALRKGSSNALKNQKDYCIAAMDYLSKAFAYDNSNVRTRQSMWEGLLYREVEGFRKRLEVLDHEPGEYFAVLLQELHAMTATDGRMGQSESDEEELLTHALKELDAGSLEQKQKQEMLSGLYRMKAALKRRRGQLKEAEEALDASVQLGGKGEDDGSIYIDRMKVHRMAGEWELALTEATKARESFEKRDDLDGLLSIVGELGQLNKRLGRFDEALKLTLEGYQMALKRGDIREQAAFKADESQLLLGNGDIEGAEAAARASGKLSRSIMDGVSDLKVHGILVRCSLEKGDVAAAERDATVGLHRAIELKNTLEQGSFLTDLGTVASARGQYERAVNQFHSAASAFVKAGHLEVVPSICVNMQSSALDSEDWTLITKASFETIVMCIGIPEHMRAVLVVRLIEMLKKAVHIGPAQKVHDGVYGIFAFTLALLMSEKTVVTDSLRLLHGALELMAFWVGGHAEQAAAGAAALDRATREMLDFTEFVSQVPPRIPTSMKIFLKLKGLIRSIFQPFLRAWRATYARLKGSVE